MNADILLALLFGLGCVGLVLVLVLGIPAYSVIVGFRRRRRAQEYVAAAEPALQQLVTTNLAAADHSGGTTLVLGAVAYAADFPSRWVSQWKNLFGGGMVSMTEQADLARRIAQVRMFEDAQRHGALGVANIRFETNELFSGNRQNSMVVIEMLAYGTALLPAQAVAGAAQEVGR